MFFEKQHVNKEFDARITQGSIAIAKNQAQLRNKAKKVKSDIWATTAEKAIAEQESYDIGILQLDKMKLLYQEMILRQSKWK